MRKSRKIIPSILVAVFGLNACVTYPDPGPSRPAFVGDGRTQAEFIQADAYCRNLAQERTGPTPGEAAGESTAKSAAVGTLLGAALGAALGAIGGRAGLGAAVGAGAGLLGGAAAGASAGQASAAAVQRRYDAEYYQCMDAAGHKVPGGVMRQAPPPPPAPSQFAPPPPPAGPSGAAPCRPSGRFGRTPEGVKGFCE